MSLEIQPLVRRALPLAAALALSQSAPAPATVHHLSPTHERASASLATFPLRGVELPRVVRAYVRTGSVRHRLSVSALRRAHRGGAISVRVPRAHGRVRASGRSRLTLVTDTTPPNTTVSGGPEGTVTQTSARFTLRASERRATFECSFDGAAWATCSSRPSLSRLGPGTHVFAARAKDRAGNVDPTPATRTWTIQGPSPQPPPAPAPEPPPAEPTPQPPPAEPPPGPIAEPPTDSALLFDDFTGPDGVITNQYAYWSSDARAIQSPIWEMDSGSLLRRGNSGWTGVPDSVPPNFDSSNGTNSAVFRLWTRRQDFGDVRVEMLLRNAGFTSGTSQVPAQGWDGVKLMLRRSGKSFYAVFVHTREGWVAVQKKCLGGDVNGGTYYTLAQTARGSHPAPIGAWERVGAVVRDGADGSVTIQVIRSGAQVLQVRDSGTGCAPFTGPRGLGVRGDNTEFSIDDFRVTAAP
jgi:hypothetical protein